MDVDVGGDLKEEVREGAFVGFEFEVLLEFF